MITNDKNLEMVREFNERFEHKTPNRMLRLDNMSDKVLAIFRHGLIAEEAQELIEAIGKGDQVEMLDALCDLQYVLDGMFLVLGLAGVKDAAMNEVHRSNMSKLDKNGHPIFREDGKIMKGENYSPPDLKTVLSKYLQDNLQNPL